MLHKEGSQNTDVSQGELRVQCTGNVLGMFALHEEALDENSLHEGHSGARRGVFHEEGSQHVPGCTCLCQLARWGLWPITKTWEWRGVYPRGRIRLPDPIPHPRFLTGNKGAVGVSFMFNGTSFGFVNCHLTSGNEKTAR